MSIRWIGTRLFRHGQAYVRAACRREYNTGNIAEKVKQVAGSTAGAIAAPTQGTAQTQFVQRGFALRNVGVQVGLHARRILIDSVLSRVTNTLAADLRKRAARRLMYGDSGTFFAFVGVSLASGTGILTKEEELEGVCWEIRDAISKIKWSYHEIDSNVSRFENEPMSLSDLTLGQSIAKGSMAAVYAAKVHEVPSVPISVEVVENEQPDQRAGSRANGDSPLEYPLAVKMMFNYDIQSSAMAILRAMYRETIPARVFHSNTGDNDWELDLSNRQRHLPPHPNIVAMFSVFTDYVPELPGADSFYPAALPRRIHPEGEGRNMSLFLLMKRYTCTVRDYLSEQSPSSRNRILLLAQLLEGVAHLSSHGIAHRDLKSDNLLIDVQDAESPPQLVISDFGCCLADKSGSLSVPFNSLEVYMGGNPVLMAPEIMCAQPGVFSSLNYARSDLWAAGALAYELFGRKNPFYEGETREAKKLENKHYKMGDLPELPADVPKMLRALVRSCLERNPNRRLEPEVAANVCQLYLWAPSYWVKPGLTKLPSSAEILQWLLTLTTKVLCEGQLQSRATPNLTGVRTCHQSSSVKSDNPNVTFKNGRRTYPEYLLISTFLCRARLYKIKAALKFIQSSLNDM